MASVHAILNCAIAQVALVRSRDARPNDIASKIDLVAHQSITCMSNHWRVAIIGGGSAGVATARAMLAAGHLPTLYESRSSLGGLWAVNEPSKLLYDGLKTNLPTVVMQSPLAPEFPTSSPSFVEAEALFALL